MIQSIVKHCLARWGLIQLISGIQPEAHISSFSASWTKSVIISKYTFQSDHVPFHSRCHFENIVQTHALLWIQWFLWHLIVFKHLSAPSCNSVCLKTFALEWGQQAILVGNQFDSRCLPGAVRPNLERVTYILLGWEFSWAWTILYLWRKKSRNTLWWLDEINHWTSEPLCQNLLFFLLVCANFQLFLCSFADCQTSNHFHAF